MNYKQEIREESQKAKSELTAAGIEFTDSPFAAYVIIKSESYKIGDVIDVLDEAKEEIESGDSIYDDLTEAVADLATQSKGSFEYCTNGEWLEVYGNFVQDEENDDNSNTDWEAVKEHRESVESAFDSYAVEFESAGGQRILCHGWNGAAFTHHNRGVGTFEVLTESAEKLFDSI